MVHKSKLPGKKWPGVLFNTLSTWPNNGVELASQCQVFPSDTSYTYVKFNVHHDIKKKIENKNNLDIYSRFKDKGMHKLILYVDNS